MSNNNNENPDEIFYGERFVPGILDDQLCIEHYQRYNTISTIAEGKVVVDAACGEGYGTSIISKKAKRVIGIDIDAEAINRAKKNYINNKIDFIVADITNIPLEDHTVDLFVSFETIEHVSQEYQYKFLEEIYRVLKKDGILIMSTPNKQIYSDLYNYHNKFHIKEFYKGEFEKFLLTRFANVKLYHQFFEVVGVIDNFEETSSSAYYSNPDSKYRYDGKYFIGIASNEEIPKLNLTSVYMNKQNEYEEKIERIVSLQQEVESRNLHIVKLNQIIDENGNIIRNLQGEVAERNNHIKFLGKQIEQLNEKINSEINQLDKVINDKDRITNQKNQEINNLNKVINDRDYIINQKNQEINNLNKVINDRDYIINQKDSRIIDLEHRSIRIPRAVFRLGGKIIKIPRKTYEIIFPLDTKRRMVISKIKNKSYADN